MPARDAWALLIQQASSLQVGAISSIHAENLVTFLWVLIAWLWPVRTRRPVVLGLTIGLSLVSQLLTSVALGGEWGTSSRVAAVTVVQAGVTLALYRWRIGDDNLAPHRPSDIVDLFAASLVGALVVIPFGPASGLSLSSSSFELFWWTVLSTAYVFVGSACLLLLVQRRPREEAIPTRVMDVYLQLLVTGVCLGVVFTFDGLPLTWIVMLPAIWAGFTLGPWTSAAYSLTGTLAVVTAQAIPEAGMGYGIPELSRVLLLDSLMTAFVFVVLLLSLMRDQRAHLAGEVVHRRQEAVDQAGLLGTVFESINEALVLTDLQGEVQLHNAAAVSILGPEKLLSEPARWLRRLPEGPTFTYAYNKDGSEDGLRVLEVHLASVQYAGSDSIVAVVRDVTSEQRRIEELASFAAVAAHDLKSPLAAVQGWIEVAEDALANDAHMAIEALQRGRQATDRMSREIEDWLTYNVAREGVVQPEAIALPAMPGGRRRQLPRPRHRGAHPGHRAGRPHAAAPPALEPDRQRREVPPPRRASLRRRPQLLGRRARLGPALRGRRRHRHPRG